MRVKNKNSIFNSAHSINHPLGNPTILINSSIEEDRRVIFFLGAGASKAAGLYTMEELVEEVQRNIKSPSVDNKAIYECFTEIKQNLKEPNNDIEKILEEIDKLENINTPHNWTNDKIEIVNKVNAIKNTGGTALSGIVRQEVRKALSKTNFNIDFFYGFKIFLDKSKKRKEPLHIFTTNYDLVIELFADKYKLKITDGFRGYWDPSEYEKTVDISDINLYKIHGSIIWYQTKAGRYLSIPVFPDTKIDRLYNGEYAAPVLFYPGQKLDYAEPLWYNTDKLRKLLSDEETRFVVVIGYSFRDEHIKKIFFESAQKNRELIVIIVDPNALKITHNLSYIDEEKNIESPLISRLCQFNTGFKEILPELDHILARIDHIMKETDNGKKYEKLINADEVIKITDNMISSFEYGMPFLFFNQIKDILIKAKKSMEEDKLSRVDKLTRMVSLINLAIKMSFLWKRIYSNGKDYKEYKEIFKVLNDELYKPLPDIWQKEVLPVLSSSEQTIIDDWGQKLNSMFQALNNLLPYARMGKEAEKDSNFFSGIKEIIKNHPPQQLNALSNPYDELFNSLFKFIKIE
jgi:hypothetical protein